MDPLKIYEFVLGLVVLGIAAVALFRSKREAAVDIERERRQFLDEVGRIIDGHVLDVQEVELEGREAQMVMFQYEVSGVNYEASQDVTQLRPWINLQSCRTGLHASVKYDPLNPGNSVLITEKWNGLGVDAGYAMPR
jgi:hypothetical protein